MGDVALLLGGLTLLYFGAGWLVSGASALALSLRVPQLIVGLTVVAYGTSAPEVVVGVRAAVGGQGAVALGNVIGSNIANLGLILGMSALLKPTRVDGALRRRELPVLAVTTAALLLVLADGAVARWEGAALLLAGALYTAWMIRASRSAGELAEAMRTVEGTAEAAAISGAPQPWSRGWLVLIALVGLGVLLLGGHLFVTGATAVARALGMSERLVGLTIVAVGTSLPELATSLIAASRGHSDIAVGNVVGSNIFNVVLCLGAVGLVGGVRVPVATLATDLAALFAFTAVGVTFLRTERTMRRWEGAVLLTAYVAFLGWLTVG